MFFIYYFLCYLFSFFIVNDRSYNVDYLGKFNSKTAYRNVASNPLDKSSEELFNCNLVHMNTVFRHGTRSPSLSDMENMEKVFEKINNSAGRLNLRSEFLNWQLPFLKNESKTLSNVGIEEMMGLGTRFRKIFDGIAGSNVDKHIKAFTSTIHRSKLSGETFLRMFLNGTRLSTNSTSIILTDANDRLRFFDDCSLYSTRVKENRTMKVEYLKFLNGKEISRVVDDIKKKWQIEDVSLTNDDIRILYIMCGYEIGNNISSVMKSYMCPLKDGLVDCSNSNGVKYPERSTLCSLFKESDFDTLDYLYDLKHYWLKAYSHPINYLISCTLMSSIYEQIIQAINEHKVNFLSDYTRAVFWFGHAETILPLVSLFGLFNQTLPMTSEAFRQRLSLTYDPNNSFSLFRAKQIIPFGANLELDLYHCPHMNTDNDRKYRVQVRVNEQVVPWPNTNGLTYISIDEFKKRFAKCSSDDFSHHNLCKIG